MQNSDTLFRNAKLSDGTLSSISVKEGRITSIEPDSGNDISTENIVDLSGTLVVPGFVEGHVHLDTSFYGDTWRPYIPCSAGFDVRERVEIQRENMFGLRMGASADFVALHAEHVPEVVVAVPKNRSIYEAGKCIVRQGSSAGAKINR